MGARTDRVHTGSSRKADGNCGGEDSAAGERVCGTEASDGDCGRTGTGTDEWIVHGAGGECVECTGGECGDAGRHSLYAPSRDGRRTESDSGFGPGRGSVAGGWGESRVCGAEGVEGEGGDQRGSLHCQLWERYR